MTEPIDLPVIDEPPKSGVWVDHEEWFGDLSDDEIAEGNRLGGAIDPDDDDDNGGVDDE